MVNPEPRSVRTSLRRRPEKIMYRIITRDKTNPGLLSKTVVVLIILSVPPTKVWVSSKGTSTIRVYQAKS